MKAAFLDDAEPVAVSHAVRDVLEQRGALVSEHLHSRVRFRGLTPGKYAWSRDGYVGIYQNTGERSVEVRLLLRARWPYRILLGVATLNVLGIIATIALQPSGTVFFLVAFLAAFALLAAGVLYLGTLKHVRAEERALMDAFEAEFQKDIAGASILDQEEAELRRLEAELEGEIARRRVKAQRKGEPRLRVPKPSFSLRPNRKTPTAVAPTAGGARSVEVQDASDDDLAARREELLRRKAELEARRETMRRES